MFDPTVMAQIASWSHGRRYPVKESSRVNTGRMTPMTRIELAGRLVGPVKTRNMWIRPR
jgi:hypothetical protein